MKYPLVRLKTYWSSILSPSAAFRPCPWVSSWTLIPSLDLINLRNSRLCKKCLPYLSIIRDCLLTCRWHFWFSSKTSTWSSADIRDCNLCMASLVWECLDSCLHTSFFSFGVWMTLLAMCEIASAALGAREIDFSSLAKLCKISYSCGTMLQSFVYLLLLQKLRACGCTSRRAYASAVCLKANSRQS